MSEASALSDRTIGRLVAPFVGGAGPSHTAIEQVWRLGDAFGYLPEDGSKADRVAEGLRRLRSGEEGWDDIFAAARRLAPDADKLLRVVRSLIELLLEADLVDDRLRSTLASDGISIEGDDVIVATSTGPAERLRVYVDELFGDRDEFRVARRHYANAMSAYDRGEWEGSNGQLRSALDATFDALAHARGCPTNKRGGAARKWLVTQGHLDEGEGDLVKAYMAFAGANGSHAGLSGHTEGQLRRHFTSALIAFATLKLDTE